MDMDKDILREVLRQHRVTTCVSLDRVTGENQRFRLNAATASIGFIYRHIAETINLFAQMLGAPGDVTNTTIGRRDVGQCYEIGESRELIERGYAALQDLLEAGTHADWLRPVETPFFGTVPRIRLFAHTLFHTSHHAGQISLALARGTFIPHT